MRMFVAVVPPVEVVEELEAFLEVRRDTALRWTRPAQWHLTLAFLPDVAEHAVEPLVEALADVAGKRRPLTMALVGGGAFPDPARARVLWTGVETDPLADAAELARLAAGCRTAAATHGVEAPREKFVPHVTLARSGHPVEATRWLRVLETFRSSPFTADRVTLFSSHLGEGPRRTPRYAVEAEVLLG